MGYRNVQAVVLLWSDLGGAEYKLLNAMALRSHDDTGVCWMPAEDMANALGHHGDKARGHHSSGQAAARRSLLKLERAGAILRRSKASPGRTAEWQMTLARPDAPALAVDNPPVDNEEWGNTSVPQWGNTSVPNGATPVFPMGQHQCYPPDQETKRPRREIRGEVVRNPHQRDAQPVDNPPAPNEPPAPPHATDDAEDVPLPLAITPHGAAMPIPAPPEIVPLTTETERVGGPAPELAPVIPLAARHRNRKAAQA